jgi:hypothetical protein
MKKKPPPMIRRHKHFQNYHSHTVPVRTMGTALIRCKYCTMMNKPYAVHCAHCGAPNQVVRKDIPWKADRSVMGVVKI